MKIFSPPLRVRDLERFRMAPMVYFKIRYRPNHSFPYRFFGCLPGSNIWHSERGREEIIQDVAFLIDWLVEVQKFGLTKEKLMVRAISKPFRNYLMSFHKPHCGHHDGNVTFFREPERVELNTEGVIKETVERLQRETSPESS